MAEATRPLRVVDATEPMAVWEPLGNALFDDGPAILPRQGGVLPSDLPDRVPAEVAVVIETSGSTGVPKRVWLTKEAVLTAAKTHLDALGGPGFWWLALPVHYIAGLQVMVRSLLAHTTPVLSREESFGAEALLSSGSALREAGSVGPLYTSLVPTQLQRLVTAARSDQDVASMLRLFDRILVGGQAIPKTLLDEAAGLGLRVTRTYGSAETAGGCVWDGRPLPGVAVRDVDGRIQISGPMLAGGYLGNPSLTAERFVEEDGIRWYVTDDAGVVAEDGAVTITGRVDDVIVSGGVKVSLAAIQRVLADDLGYLDAVVVPASHSEWGQVPVVVTTTPLDLEAVRRHLGEVVGPAARPFRVHRVDRIPLLPSGKPDRLLLTDQVAQAED